MDIRNNPLWLSFPIGRWFRTDVRVSFLLPLMVVFLCSRLGFGLGLACSGLLFASILLHEFGHVFAARWTGGRGDEILMWPLGGLAFVNPAPTFSSEAWTTLAGPLINLILCAVSLPAVLYADLLRESLTLMTVPYSELSSNWPVQCFVLTFSLNFKLLMLNLLPIYPLDGGQFTYSVSKLYWEHSKARLGSLWFGTMTAVIIAIAGWMLNSTDVTGYGFLLAMMCQYEFLRILIVQMSEGLLGTGHLSDNEFSSSLLDDADAEPQPGALERWKLARAERRREKEEQERIATAQRVDELLDKVHQHGISSLTEAERRFLERASSSYRKTEQ